MFWEPIYFTNLQYFLMLCNITLLVIMSVQDWRTMEVSGELCVIGWVLIAVDLYIFKSSTVTVLFTIASFILFYSPLEIPVLGDADFIPLLMVYITLSRSSTMYAEIQIYGFALLIVSLLYPILYTRFKDKNYKVSSREPTPGIPAYTLPYACTLIIVYIIQFERGGYLFVI